MQVIVKNHEFFVKAIKVAIHKMIQNDSEMIKEDKIKSYKGQ